MGAETSLRHERTLIETLSRQINDLTHQKMSLSDELALASAQVSKQERVMQEQESLIESLRRAHQDAEMLVDSLKKQFAAEAERAQATLTANENLRAAAQEADRAVARSERGFVEAREKIEVLEHDKSEPAEVGERSGATDRRPDQPPRRTRSSFGGRATTGRRA